MGWKIYSTSEIDSKWDVWDRLNGLYYNRHPYFDSRFIKPCLKYFGNSSVKLAELMDNQNEISGMMLIQKNSFGTWSLFLVPQMQIAPVLLNPKNIIKDLKELMHTLPLYCWRIQCLYQDPEYTPLNSDENGMTAKKYHCTTTRIELENDFIFFWEQRKKNLKKNVYRYLNKIEKENIKVSFVKLSQPDELKKGLYRYGQLENLGWKGKAGTAIHPNNVQGYFYNEMIQNFSLNNQASIFELYLNNILAASRLCLNTKETIIILKVTYNENLKQFSPGKLLLYKMIEKEFEEKEHQQIEFYTNASKDQIDWSTSTRDIYHYEIYRNKLFNQLVQLKNRKNKLKWIF